MAIERDPADAKGRGAADDRTDVAGVLDAFEEDFRAVPLELRQRDLRSDAWRRLGVGDGAEDRSGEDDRRQARLPYERGYFWLGERGLGCEDGYRLDAGSESRGNEVRPFDNGPALAAPQAAIADELRPALDLRIGAR